MINFKYKRYIIVLLAAFVLLLGSSLAYYSWGSEENTDIAFDVVNNEIFIYYSSGSDIIGANLYPVSNKEKGIVKDIFVKTSLDSSNVTFNLYLDLLTLPSALRHSSFKYALYQESSLVTSGDFANASTSSCSTNSTNHIVLLSNVHPTTTEIRYKLYIWIDGTSGNNPISMADQSFNFALHADGQNAILKTLYDEIITGAVMDNTSSTYVSSSSGINFNSISSDTNGKGIYIRSGTENDRHPIYYYRGAVTNNNVLFANKCWKIVRTTETGGIKLIYNGTPSNGTCNNTGTNTQIGTSTFNTYATSVAYSGYMYGDIYSTNNSIINADYVFGNDVSYDANTGNYTLLNTKIAGASWSSQYNTINNNHYACITNGDCSKVNYIFKTTSTEAYYITLSNGEKISDAFSNMLEKNKNDSTIKTYIDSWFSSNINNYLVYLEDTVFCSDSGITNYVIFNPNGGSTNNWLNFDGLSRAHSSSPSLVCSRDIDKFTVSENNGNGDLTYPVGLLTSDEVMLAGGLADNIPENTNNSYYLYTGKSYSLITPYGFSSDANAYIFFVNDSGVLSGFNSQNQTGVRPVISLVYSVPFSVGDGTASNPYIIY